MPSRQELESQSIFGEQPGITLSVARHNVVDLVPRAKNELRTIYEKQYNMRGGAIDYTRPHIGLLVPLADEKILRHAEYLGATMKRSEPFSVYTYDDIRRDPLVGIPDTLVVPYINNEQTKNYIEEELGQQSWGLPPEMVRSLKNKANFQNLIEEANIPGMEVPDYLLATQDTLIKQASRLLKDIQELYKENGVPEYPLGLVFRADQSDGNYGQAFISEQPDGRILMVPNGDKTQAKYLPKGAWKQALEQTEQAFKDSLECDDNSQIVISRFVDVADDPGISEVIQNGYVSSLGWNTQIHTRKSLACVGTMPYERNDLQSQYEDKTVEDFEKLLRFTANEVDIPFEQISALVNLDVMLPDQLEIKLREARGQGIGYYVAESNPRITNYTDGILLGVGIRGETPSVRGMQRIIEDGIVMLDKVDLRGADPEKVGIELQKRDSSEKRTRAILRTPTPQAGVVLLGDYERAMARVRRSIAVAGGKDIYIAA
jgi:hypothetical protein